MVIESEHQIGQPVNCFGSVHYLIGEETGEILHTFFMEVIEWLRKENFANTIEITHGAGMKIGKIRFCPAERNVYDLRYQPVGLGKDEIDNAIILTKVHYFINSQRLFQCDLADPDLWERTLNALRSFRYSSWAE